MKVVYNVEGDPNPRRVVYKYALPANENNLTMPYGAKVLHFAEQHGQFCLWALVDPAGRPTSRHFKIVGTGNPEFYDDRVEYIGSALVDQGAWVFHCFEVVT